jgi:hypothetical protein
MDMMPEAERGDKQCQAEPGGESAALARPLKVLVPMIKDELDAGDAAGIEHYRRAGAMLLEAKSQIAHGEWTGWITRNFHLGARQARRYMELAELSENGRPRPFSSLSEAVEPKRPSHHGVTWYEPVRRIAARVNLEALRQYEESKEKEAALTRDLAHKLIEIGYKVLAQKLHPDKPGGSKEAMQRLNEVRALLRIVSGLSKRRYDRRA